MALMSSSVPSPSFLLSALVALLMFSSSAARQTTKDLEDVPTNERSRANIVVASNGSGNFRTIAAAIQAAPVRSKSRFVIYVKAGVYHETLKIGVEKPNLTLVGDGMDVTVISYNKNSQSPDPATLVVEGDGFMASDLTIENTVGPHGGAAPAVRTKSDKSVFYRCGIYGYQDTLYAQSQRQFYRECRIKGTVDFIFGSATAVFQGCQVLARQAARGQDNVVSANGRDAVQGTGLGFSFHKCNVSGDDDLVHSKTPTRTFLGRPWRMHSTTVFMQSFLSGVVQPKGWLEWDHKSYESTLFYGEYSNQGAGADTRNRVTWPGYHKSLEHAVAEKFTVSKLISGDEWLPSMNVPFDGGLD